MNEDSLEQPHANPSVPNYTASTNIGVIKSTVGERAIPLPIIEAARLVEHYFTTQGIEHWELMGICSREQLSAAVGERDCKRSVLEKLVSLIPEHKHGTFDFNYCHYCKALAEARAELAK